MVIIIKYYLVDSENVNDNWLLLLDMANAEDEIIVFYTKNSPHMSYASVIRLLNSERSIRFEECYEGNNALDFQLISCLGYLMKNDELEDSEYIIMSNDTGFDSAVNFWKERNFPVNRINVNYCKLYLQRQRENIASTTEELPFSGPSDPEPAREVPKTEKVYNFNKDEVDIFINCLGKDNLVAIHETLVHVYGPKQGQIIYKAVKDKSYPVAEKEYSRKDKVKQFSDIIFSHSDITSPENFVEFLEKSKDKAKNLNGIRAAIVKSYGKGNGMKYYSLFKPYFKMISALK